MADFTVNFRKYNEVGFIHEVSFSNLFIGSCYFGNYLVTDFGFGFIFNNDRYFFITQV